MIDAEDAAAWEKLEADYFAREQARVDRVRVRGYTLARMKLVEPLRAELERRVTLLLRARTDAERALANLHEELEHLEEMGRLIALEDDAITSELAKRVEHLEEIGAIA